MPVKYSAARTTLEVTGESIPMSRTLKTDIDSSIDFEDVARPFLRRWQRESGLQDFEVLLIFYFEKDPVDEAGDSQRPLASQRAPSSGRAARRVPEPTATQRHESGVED